MQKAFTAAHFADRASVSVSNWTASRVVTACGRICMHRKRVSLSHVLAGQRGGIKEVDDGIWTVSFMHYDPGDIDMEQRTWQPPDNPLGTRLSPMF